jgi:hypothetical protein
MHNISAASRAEATTPQVMGCRQLVPPLHPLHLQCLPPAPPEPPWQQSGAEQSPPVRSILGRLLLIQLHEFLNRHPLLIIRKAQCTEQICHPTPLLRCASSPVVVGTQLSRHDDWQ